MDLPIRLASSSVAHCHDHFDSVLGTLGSRHYLTAQRDAYVIEGALELIEVDGEDSAGKERHRVAGDVSVSTLMLLNDISTLSRTDPRRYGHPALWHR